MLKPAIFANLSRLLCSHLHYIIIAKNFVYLLPHYKYKVKILEMEMVDFVTLWLLTKVKQSYLN